MEAFVVKGIGSVDGITRSQMSYGPNSWHALQFKNLVGLVLSDSPYPMLHSCHGVQIAFIIAAVLPATLYPQINVILLLWIWYVILPFSGVLLHLLCLEIYTEGGHISTG